MSEQRTIRVLHVIDSLDLGGAQTSLVNLARYHNRERFELTVAPMHGSGIFSKALESVGVRVISLSAAKWPPNYLLSLPRLLRHEPFDIVHFHLFGSNWIGKPIAALCGVRLRVNHDQCNDRMRTDRWWCLAVDRLTNYLSSHIFAVSNSTRNCLVRQEKISETKISLLSNAVDVERFCPPSPEQRKVARRKLSVESCRCVVVGLGRLHPQKNWPLFLRVAERFPQIDFLIAGTGPEEKALLRLAPGNVRFVGFQDSRDVLMAADVFMLTSDYEGTPMTLLEAMACGLPSIASAVDGCEEILGDGVGGATAQPGDPAEFTEKLSPLLENEALRNEVGEAARKKVLQQYDARQQARAVEAIYEKLLAGR